MTLEEDMNNTQFLSEKCIVGESLKRMLLDGLEQRRLTCGIYDCGTLLYKSADTVMLCVLPDDSSNDVTLHIHFTLIEAFCWENDIRIVKVDSVDKLHQLLNVDKELTDPRWPPSWTDYNCVLIEYPHDDVKLSVAESIILDFYKNSCDISPQPIIELKV